MDLQQIYSINLISVFEKITKIIYKSQKYWCCCVLHSEKTPSCIVNEKKFYCFGCGENGNIITFYMKYYNLEFQPALIRICEDFNIKITHNNSDQLLTKLLNSACEIYTSNLFMINNYIQKRNISNDMISIFKLGYSHNNYILPQLIKQGYSLQNIQNSGILQSNSLDSLCNRLIFPLINKNNNIIGFSGRAITNDILPKYLNCKDTVLFHKSNYLYGEHLLTTNTPFAIIVEGYLDVITAYNAGIRNIVSIMGTSIHDYSITTLFNYVNTIYIMLDNDDAGINAIKRNLPLLCKYITNIKRVYICKLNQHKDIDELINSDIKNSYNKVQEILHNAEFVLSWAIKNSINHMKNMTDQEKKITEIEYIKNLCGYIQHETTRKIYINHYIQTIKNFKQINHNINISNPEKQLISLLLQNSDIIESFIEELLNIRFQNQTYEEIRIIITLSILYKKNIYNTLLTLKAQFPEEIINLINNVENKYIIINRSFMLQYIMDLFERIKKINNAL